MVSIGSCPKTPSQLIPWKFISEGSFVEQLVMINFPLWTKGWTACADDVSIYFVFVCAYVSIVDMVGISWIQKRHPWSSHGWQLFRLADQIYPFKPLRAIGNSSSGSLFPKWFQGLIVEHAWISMVRLSPPPKKEQRTSTFLKDYF